MILQDNLLNGATVVVIIIYWCRQLWKFWAFTILGLCHFGAMISGLRHFSAIICEVSVFRRCLW
ncbi:hypothetical protein C2G38_2237434 [Gigaspora rosea]|uniref:Uncharacterized protein n=1 Tax=Gigaspora rosea TaxID=44941 RepID=A0A397TNQ4_9GLOM|nr:hypothetical protein C2G38_2237434 [Gigaspora rosea]